MRIPGIWLNSYFLNQAFNEEEQKEVLPTSVSAGSNPNSDTNPGSDTIDKVFVLSIYETDKYCRDLVEMQCRPTEYAKAQGCIVNQESGNCLLSNVHIVESGKKTKGLIFKI